MLKRVPSSLSAEERRELERRVRRYTSPYFQVVRAQIVLLAADGRRNDEIAEYPHTNRDVVSQWRKRFYEKRLAGLEERPRPGRPRAFPQTLVASISGSTVWRWLSEDAIRLCYRRSWMLPRDADFETKAGRILELY